MTKSPPRVGHPSKARRRCGIGAGLATVIACVWLASGFSDAPRSEGPLRIVVSGDTAGWIMPCGCASGQLGGLLRRGTYVSGLRATGEVILLDAGGAPGGTSPYQRVRFEAILEGEVTMGVDAHNLGGPEAALGADTLRRAAERTGIAFVSANLRDSGGRLVADPVRVVERGGRRVAVIGVLSRAYATAGVQIDDPVGAVLTTVGRIDAEYDALVILAYLPEEELAAFARAVPEADLVVGGPTGQNMVPRRVGPSLLASATNKGKFLVEFDVPAPGSDGSWRGRMVEMAATHDDDPAQAANVEAYLGRLAQRDFPAGETGFATFVGTRDSTGYAVAGTETCRACHLGECGGWDETGHASAWDTVKTRGHHVDPYCQQCHTTGYGMPDGFLSVRGSPDRRDVGCESCHGPSAAHADDPQTPTAFEAADQCVRCHDRENSPMFDYATYWPRIAHGTNVAIEAPLIRKRRAEARP